MKQLLLFTFLSVFTISLHAQVFVNADAAGTADGSSWDNAYTNLNDALLAADSGAEVWIAAGTYITPDSTSFFIDKELTVLGGFAGTETSADDANPAANETILSGDVDGDDPAAGMPFDTAAFAENNRVLFITDTSTVASQYTVTLDGLTIANGGSPLDRPEGSNAVAAFSGGGILTFARVNMSRITFRSNRSFFGSALAVLSSTANASVLDDITLDRNYSGPGRQLYINSSNGVSITNSVFDGLEGTQQSGFVQIAFTQDVVFENCEFKNLTTSFSGAGIRSDNCDDVTVRSCTFDELNASTGGAIYTIQAENLDIYEMDEDDFVLDGCSLTNCSVEGRGGAITAFDNNIKVINSSLSENTAAGIGGGLYQVTIDSRSYSNVLDKTVFDENVDGTGDFDGDGEPDGGAGGGCMMLILRESSLNGRVVNSTFSENTSGRDGTGGALYIQGRLKVDILNSTFTENVAGFGTIFLNGAVDVDIMKTKFEENGTMESAFQGGAICAYFRDGANGLVVDSSEFRNNVIGDHGTFLSAGAGIYGLGLSSTQTPVTVSNTIFQNNAATDGRSGGASYFLGSFDLEIDNCDFLGNTSAGEGGAIAFRRDVERRDTSDAGIVTTTLDQFDADISNSRFYNQLSDFQGGAISTQRAAFNLTNNSFAQNNVSAMANGGGAISINGNRPSVNMDNELDENIGAFEQEYVFIHNTFSDNTKGGSATAVGDHIAVYQPGSTGGLESNSIKISLLNNAFVLSSGSAAFEVEPDGTSEMAPLLPIGDIEFESLGGNFFSGLNGVEFQVGDNDTVEEDITTPASDLFVDPEANEEDFPNLDLLVTEDNPLINAGVTSALVPDEDIRDNPRGDAPDIGAYEAEFGAVDTDEPIENSGLKLDFYPNPTADVLNIRNDDPSILNYDVLVADQIGRVLKATRFSGSNGRIDMTNLPAGTYNLRLVVNGNIYSKQVVKQ